MSPLPPNSSPPAATESTEPVVQRSDAERRQRARRYWALNQRVTGWLLLLWFAVTFGFTVFADSLTFTVLGWPFSFWVAAQGSLLVYIMIVFVYAWVMDRLDARYRP